MDYATIRCSVSDRILTIALNRPEKLNAFSSQMMLDLISAIDHADADDEIRAVIMTGEGRGFCAGADLSGGSTTFDYLNASHRAHDPGSPLKTDGEIDWGHDAIRDSAGRVTLRLFECLKPVICAVNGPAVGAGATIPLAADIRIASTTAKFGYVFSRRGIVAEGCSSWFLPRIVGISRALEWSLSGRLFNAEEALAAGLVRSLHEPGEIMTAARKIARDIVDNAAPVSTALIRQMMWKMLGADHPMEAHRIDSMGVFARGRSADAAEGIASFMDKRGANFTDVVSDDMPSFFPWWSERTFR